MWVIGRTQGARNIAGRTRRGTRYRGTHRVRQRYCKCANLSRRNPERRRFEILSALKAAV